ncbi:unnamed protein product [Haemonchus placei]|uniref:Uncharacterized protein n=1 Tax=Haemonchus placei TaxID=6290 RepID=A0A0N4X7R4_HAEPC|nr:unnamed protein product [Haemonchus placei]
MPHSLSFIICLIVVLLLLPTELLASEDCYKYSKKEFTTITACDHGCEYVYKNKAICMPVYRNLRGGYSFQSSIELTHL